MVWDTSHQHDDITSFRFGNFSWEVEHPKKYCVYKKVLTYIYIYNLI